MERNVWCSCLERSELSRRLGVTEQQVGEEKTEEEED
jgi:hypothetical protein